MTRTRHPITDQPALQPKPGKWSAMVSADLFHALAPLRGTRDKPDKALNLNRHLHCYRIEPRPNGDGVIVIVSDGYAVGVGYDRGGYCTAPMTVYLPPDAVAACAKTTPPELCVEDFGPVRRGILPGWALPGSVYLSHDLVQVSNASTKRPASLYRWTPGDESPEIIPPVFYGDQYVDWRRCLPGDGVSYTGASWGVNPRILARFSRIVDPDSEGIHLYTPSDPAAPAIIRPTSNREFFGLIMGIRPSGPGPTIPTWATETAPAATGGEESPK